MKIESWEIAMAIGAVSALGWIVVRRLAARPRISGREVVAISEASEDAKVVIAGAVQAATQPVHASMSGKACVMYRVEVQHYVRRDDYEAWDPMLDDESRADIIVSDSSGKATIRGGVAVLHPPGTLAWKLAEPDSPILEFVASRGESTAQKIRWRECVVCAGERVRVRGSARREISFGNEIVIEAPDDGWIEVEPG
jgi:hypothetical protein